jgi:transposase
VALRRAADCPRELSIACAFGPDPSTEGPLGRQRIADGLLAPSWTRELWLAQLLECGLLRGSFIPPADIAMLRDLTRYRTEIIGERVRETQRVQKLLEDAGIKLDSVVTDVLGVAGRRMLEPLIAGERDPGVLAEMALGRMRPKIGVLREALVGRSDDHHAFLLRMHLDHIDELSPWKPGLTVRSTG